MVSKQQTMLINTFNMSRLYDKDEHVLNPKIEYLNNKSFTPKAANGTNPNFHKGKATVQQIAADIRVCRKS
jgi:hypothetical protein